MISKKGLLPKEFLIADKYSVLLFIKKGRNAETYRVKDGNNKICFLKLFDYTKIKETSFDENNNLLEIEFLKNLHHDNVVSYIDDGELIFLNRKFIYLVLNFIPGETLSERIGREPIYSYYDVKHIMTDVLRGLSYLHNQNDPIIHNEITPHNIMLDLTGDIPKSVIIDFGY
ncbi:protein kinase domain-containing protein, partial [Ignavibacterium album]|uniref:protein kinase domain-containing protein n=1 Tax=Ignavibacterium album TaxID=591197 RepID=UPI0038B3390A